MIADLWYRNAIIYSLDVETFLDANGDGIGDFEGLIRRLDYLDALGINTLWLAPFQPSPDRDDGYDVADYYGVDPRFGSSGDFVEFMHEAGKRGIRVIIDLVINHTSDQHPWFQSARRDPESRYRDWYVWSKQKPKHWNKGMVFPGHQKATWTYDSEARAYYYHRFYEFQPDLNTSNPEVREELKRVMGFWLELGVAGFRVDAVPFILEIPDTTSAKWDHDYTFLYDLRRLLQLRRGDAVLLGEANVPPGEETPFLGRNGEGLQMIFNFWVNQHLFYALASGEVAPLADALRATRRLPQGCQWGHFLRTHDELDLGRLTDPQRARVAERFAPEEDMWLYDRGVRRRLAPMLGDRQHYELAHSLMFSLPGNPTFRYGDEIGMGDNLKLSERDAVRTPMQWSSERHGGFTLAEKPVMPLVTGGVYGYERVNVEDQQRDPGSLLNWNASMIRLRKECPEIGWGEWQLLGTGSPHVLAMQYEWRGNALVIVHNFSDRAVSVRIRPRAEDGDRLVDLRVEEESRARASGAHHLVLEPYGYRWFRVGGLNYALRASRY
ncbi:MAG TPA: alpha-amylase family protein [Longimicrobiales bacterium]|nr:alpha-amylase family protein [Longimicrobiales bacterium]